MYAEFVDMVDPKGYIIDFLIQKSVVNLETAEQLRRKETSHDCCRSLLYELGSHGNPTAFVELCRALEHEYQWIVARITEGTITTMHY